MFGFIGTCTYGKENDTQLVCDARGKDGLLSNELQYHNIKVQRKSLNKFPSDKVFYESDRTIILIEGVIYNFVELEKEYKTANRGIILERKQKVIEEQLSQAVMNGKEIGLSLHDMQALVALLYEEAD